MSKSPGEPDPTEAQVEPADSEGSDQVDDPPISRRRWRPVRRKPTRSRKPCPNGGLVERAQPDRRRLGSARCAQPDRTGRSSGGNGHRRRLFLRTHELFLFEPGTSRDRKGEIDGIAAFVLGRRSNRFAHAKWRDCFRYDPRSGTLLSGRAASPRQCRSSYGGQGARSTD